MYHWVKSVAVAGAAMLLTGCLWGPGKFASDLALKKDGSFTLEYRGEIVLQLPPEENRGAFFAPWNDKMATCYKDGRAVSNPFATMVESPPASASPTTKSGPQARPCTGAEIAKLKAEHEQRAKDASARSRKQKEEMARAFGLPGVDDASSREFAAKLMKYEGWRSVVYRGEGVFEVDYRFSGRATQDFLFPALPDNDLLIPFIAIRRRSDGTVLVTAPAMTGANGPLGIRAGTAMYGGEGMPASRAQGRFAISTDGEILTNNSEDGAVARQDGRQLVWMVGPSSKKIPEALIRLR